MSSLSPIDLVAAALTKTPFELSQIWICPACGQPRGYEGGRPSGPRECPDCGGALAMPSPRATRRKISTSRILL